MDELQAELDAQSDRQRLNEELGDVLFACANLARHLHLDPETAVRHTNAKFEQRFQHIETWLAKAGRRPEDVSLAELEALWQRAKHADEATASIKKGVS